MSNPLEKDVKDCEEKLPMPASKTYLDRTTLGELRALATFRKIPLTFLNNGKHKNKTKQILFNDIYE